MALNPSIILAGQSPDIMGSFSRGLATGQQQNQIQQQNALTNLYQTQGAGIAAGDPGALNALAGLDPMSALKVQDARLGMDAQRLSMDSTRQSMGIQAEAAKRAAAEYARTISAEQAAAEAAQIEQAVKAGLMAPDAQSFDAMMMQMGAQDMVGKFGQRDMLATQFMSAAEVLKARAVAGSAEMSLQDRYKVVGGSLFDLGAEGGPQQVGQGAMQEETVFGPDGKPLIVRGGPGTAVKFTEGQSKDNVYATRAEGALAALEPVANELTSFGQRAVGIDPTGIVRGAVQSDTFQVAQQAGEEFLQAILRKDTGAAITAQEQELYGKTYLPQPGDGPAAIEAKRVARIRAIEAIRAGMNPEQLLASARALVNATNRADPAGQITGPQTPPRAEDASLPQTPRRLRYNPATGDFE